MPSDDELRLPPSLDQVEMTNELWAEMVASSNEAIEAGEIVVSLGCLFIPDVALAELEANGFPMPLDSTRMKRSDGRTCLVASNPRDEDGNELVRP